MSKIKVTEIAPSSSNTTSITLGTNSNVTFANGVTATSFTGDGTTLTNFPAPSTFDAANLTGTLPAIDGSNLTGVGGGGLEFIEKYTVTGGQVQSIVKTGLDYDSVYRMVWEYLEFNANSTPAFYAHMDNSTTPVVGSSLPVWSTCKQMYTNYHYHNNQYSGLDHWKFDCGSYNEAHWGGYFDFSTTKHPWFIGAMRSRSEYGFCHTVGMINFQANTNNDPNQTETQAKLNGFTFKDSGGWYLQNGSTYYLYKWKQS